MDETFLREFKQMASNGMLVHRTVPIPIYAVLGGEPQDGANFTRLLREDERIRRFITALQQYVAPYDLEVCTRKRRRHTPHVVPHVLKPRTVGENKNVQLGH